MSDSTSKARGGQKKDKTCWQCGRSFNTAMEVCPDDGARLIETGLEDQVDPLIGTIFDGRFKILKKLGEGGMGTVYSARRQDFETDVALKLLKVDFARDDGIRKRFMYEARVISNLKHPHAVRLYDFGQTSDGHVYMVMELLCGESLADRLAYRFVTYREVFDIIPPICGVLGEAHKRDVIHRDLKPENIYLLEVEGNEEFPKLLDFGIAKHKREETMTKSGTLWGTPAYMSPEQARGVAIGPSADIYGIGIMLFELISGNLPFHASTQMGYAVKHINQPVRPLSSIPGLDSVPDELDEFVMSMLAKSADQRPESMEVVAKTLERICEEYFDDELLDSVPAHEIDPMGLQKWIDEAPDVTGELEVPVQTVTEAKGGESEDSEAQQAQRQDVQSMETVAAGETPGSTQPGTGQQEGGESRTTQMDSRQVESLLDDEPGDAWPLDKVPPVAIGGGAAALVLMSVILWALFATGDDEVAELDPVASPELPVQAGEEIGSVAAPADAGNVVAVGVSRGMMVLFEAHGVIQALNSPEVAEESEADFDFLHDRPIEHSIEEVEQVEDEEDSEDLREALERTF